MASFRFLCLLAGIGCIGLVGCGSLGTSSESGLDAYAREADEICVGSYQQGVEGEEAAEAEGEEKGWSGSRIEAAIRYAWADALVGQYRMIAALGPAPEKAGLVERWARTSLVRARMYRRVGDAWLESNSRREFGADANLRIAKLMADHLAQPLPFEICGKPTSGTENPDEAIPPGQLVGYAPLTYTVEFPLDSWSPFRRVRGVYWRHHRVGQLVQHVPGAETVLVEIRLKPEYSRSVDGSDLRLIRGRRDPSIGSIEIVPSRDALD
jgi:hypothetical protein